ncbi:hypothetical protein [Pacificibacter marinus]|uniref:Acylphosphatase n=1 Tax=Pacificibacter marinus TaxID=658057 RepID=A0A1Y5T5R5_9RHOB|nr:hypothetical protein [Pacificibacter marinus]SEL21810.1 Acylphosphatase [Pacificibacter marinus]SLN56429.1 hypothetical protein PAM7971_02912 [Pacificibacter marinus]
MQIDTVTFTFGGDLPVASFAEFAQHRAARLSLTLETVAQNSDTMTVRVHGPTDLVDAFEMAMSLGPADCIVSDVRRTDNNPNRSET